MAEAQEIHLQIRVHPRQDPKTLPASNSPKEHAIIASNDQYAVPTISSPISLPRRSTFKHWGWWLAVLLNIFFVLAGQAVATLLGRFYFNEGGNSMWMATFVQSAGAPLLLFPLLLFSSPSSHPRPPLLKISIIYVVLGIMIAGDNLMYSYGLLYLPVSTYSLICATQLGFNAVFSYFINKQKFTPLIFNSVVLLTFSATLLGVNSDSSDSNIPRSKYTLGFVLTLGASATFSLVLCIIQLSFEKVVKSHNFSSVIEMQMHTNMVTTVVTVIGLFASGEWKGIKQEMEGYETGMVSYVMTLVWTAIGWQVCSVGVVGLTFIVSSLFANVISTLGLPLVPVFAVILFHDSMNGVKVLAMLIAIWGFLSYIYQHYLDDSKDKKKGEADSGEMKEMNGSA